jgi:hypothetical protein
MGGKSDKTIYSSTAEIPNNNQYIYPEDLFLIEKHFERLGLDPENSILFYSWGLNGEKSISSLLTYQKKKERNLTDIYINELILRGKYPLHSSENVSGEDRLHWKARIKVDTNGNAIPSSKYSFEICSDKKEFVFIQDFYNASLKVFTQLIKTKKPNDYSLICLI